MTERLHLNGHRQTDGQPVTRWISRLTQIVGLEVLHQLTRFSREATPGAMLTIRCTRDGFTAQTTGAIVGGSARPLTREAADELLQEIEDAGGGRIARL